MRITVGAVFAWNRNKVVTILEKLKNKRRLFSSYCTYVHVICVRAPIISSSSSLNIISRQVLQQYNTACAYWVYIIIYNIIMSYIRTHSGYRYIPYSVYIHTYTDNIIYHTHLLQWTTITYLQVNCCIIKFSRCATRIRRSTLKSLLSPSPPAPSYIFYHGRVIATIMSYIRIGRIAVVVVGL